MLFRSARSMILLLLEGSNMSGKYKNYKSYTLWLFNKPNDVLFLIIISQWAIRRQSRRKRKNNNSKRWRRRKSWSQSQPSSSPGRIWRRFLMSKKGYSCAERDWPTRWSMRPLSVSGKNNRNKPRLLQQLSLLKFPNFPKAQLLTQNQPLHRLPILLQAPLWLIAKAIQLKNDQTV